MQFRFPCTCYATLRFPHLLRHFSKPSYLVGNMKPGGRNSSVRRQNVGADRSSHDVPHLANEKEFPSLSTAISLSKGKRKTRIDLTSVLEPKSDGVPADIDSMRPHSQYKTIPPSQHTESCPPPRFSTKNLLQPQTPQKTTSPNQKERFSPSHHRSRRTTNSAKMRDEFSRNKIYRKKNDTLYFKPEFKQIESSSMADSTSEGYEWALPTSFGKKKVPYTKRKSNCHYDYETAKSDRIRDFQAVEPFDICLKENSEQNWIEKSEIQNLAVEKSKQVLGPGIVLLKSYLTIAEQVDIVKKCRELGLGSGGFYQPGYNEGAKLRLQMMCLGRNWDPQTKYKEERRKDGSKPPCIPIEFKYLVKKALEESSSLIKINAENMIPNMTPDICIVNFYTTKGRLGLHQDRDESEGSLLEGLPVVSFSIGDSAEFLYGDERDVRKAENVLLESGDVLIFGGKSRLIYHGVTSIFQNTVPIGLLEKTMLRPGRLNLTFRQY